MKAKKTNKQTKLKLKLRALRILKYFSGNWTGLFNMIQGQRDSDGDEANVTKGLV